MLRCLLVTTSILIAGAWSSALAESNRVLCESPRTLGSSGASPSPLMAARPSAAILELGLPRSDRGGEIQQIVPPTDGSNDATQSIPGLRLSKEEQARLAHAAECNKAARSVRNEYEKAEMRVNGLDQMPLAQWLKSSYRTEEEYARLKPLSMALQQYEAACLNASPNWPGLSESVGVFSIEGLQVCSGFRTSSNTVLTARHCLYERTENTLWPAVSARPMWFSYSSGGRQQYEVCDELPGAVKPGASQYSELEDYIEVRIAGSHRSPPLIPSVKKALVGGEDLLLYALFPDLALLNEDDQDLHLRFSATAGCVAYVVRDRCFIHGCQSVRGSSGAPIFIAVDGGLAFAGVHVDVIDAGPAASCPATPLPGARYNLGIRTLPAR